MLPGSNLARMTAAAGYDFILVDCEHGNIDDAMMHEQVAAIGAVPGCSPIVRIAGPEIHLVKRALDTGAHGLLCPMMSTAVGMTEGSDRSGSSSLRTSARRTTGRSPQLCLDGHVPPASCISADS